MLLNSVQVRHWSAVRQEVIRELGLPVHRAANDALILHRTWQQIDLHSGRLAPLSDQSRQA